MALVLRNAALQKQVSLLKCMKTRTVVTTAKQNNQRTPLSAATDLQKDRNCLRKSSFAKGFQTSYFKVKPTIVNTHPRQNQHTMAIKSASCTALKALSRRIRTGDNWLRAGLTTSLRRREYSSTEAGKSSHNRAQPDDSGFEDLNKRICSKCCACCGPASGPCCSPICSPGGPCYGNVTDCNCGRILPPPCNTPPKCLQYIQGYYYYPYGTWFCGPYHVCTGGVPCPGPVCPGTSCGIAPPNPNLLCGRCGPCCPSCVAAPCCCGALDCTLCNPAVSFRNNLSNDQYNTNMPGTYDFCMNDAPDPVTISWANFSAPSKRCNHPTPSEPIAKDAKRNVHEISWQGISENVAKNYPFKDTANSKLDIANLKCSPKNTT